MYNINFNTTCIRALYGHMQEVNQEDYGLLQNQTVHVKVKYIFINYTVMYLVTFFLLQSEDNILKCYYYQTGYEKSFTSNMIKNI